MKHIGPFGTAWAAVGLTAVCAVHSPFAWAKSGAREVYIVQMKGEPAATYTGGQNGLRATQPSPGQRIDAADAAVRSYLNHLRAEHAKAIGSISGTAIYDYGLTFNGFAAELTESEALALAARDDVAAIYPRRYYDLDTDRTPRFLGLNRPGGPWRQGVTGEDVVIGVLDGGVWPEHPCFADIRTPVRGDRGGLRRYGPPPASWQGSGICEFGNTAFNPGDAPFTCNNKLLQARFYVDGFGAEGIVPDECFSARDCANFGDHGTNAAGTALCNGGTDAVLDNEFVGKIAGMAPRARLAHYKVCWTTPTAPNGTCANVDLIAAVEQAVADGVDVLNLSLGNDDPTLGDAFDVSLLNATTAGVYVATSAGNAGPEPATVGSPATAPWTTAVGAMQDPGVFATGLEVQAPASIADLYLGVEGGGPVTLEDTGDIVSEVVVAEPLLGCEPLTNAEAIAGKIALVSRGACAFDLKYINADVAGAAAIVVYNDGADEFRIDPIAMSVPTATISIPGIMISFTDGSAVLETISAGEPVTARLSPSIQESRPNRIADFSARGPNGFSPDVLKPDVVAPGVAILSAGSPLGGLFDGGLFSVLQGTSFSSPHVAGLFALIKQAHPDWSPAAARSAFMTTGRQNIRETFREDRTTPFDIGGGMVVPARALDPGLVYETTPVDYAAYSCGQNIIFDDLTCGILAGSGISFDPAQMNYPSIAVSEVVGSRTIRRTVTSVASRGNGRRNWRRWRAEVRAPRGFEVDVQPRVLFMPEGASRSFDVTLTAKPRAVTGGDWRFGSLTWKSGNYEVRSPIAARAVPFSAPAEVRGSGTSGNLEFGVQFGYTGAYTPLIHGLVPAERQAGTVVDDPANDFATALQSGVGVTLETVVIPEFNGGPPAFARFALFNEDTDGNDDLDLVVFGPDTAGFPQVGVSGTPESNESVDLVFPAPGTYIVVVHAFESDGPDTNYTLSSWAFGLDDDRQNASLTNPPTAAEAGLRPDIAVSWSGLDPVARFLGAVSHSDADGILGLTLLNVSTGN